jgi:acyl dehydratase
MTPKELLTAKWSLAVGTPRELLSAILSKRLDEVLVEGSDLEQLRQIERLGFPLEPAGCDDGTPSTHPSSGAPLHRCLLLPYLSHSRLPVQRYRFSVSTDDVRHYGEQSGDLNPLHFDDEVARKYGFAGRISHGMLFNGWFTRLLGTEFPGPGTIYLRSTSVYLAPIYPGKEYTVQVSTPRHDPSRGTYRILAQLLSAEGHHATIAYADVLNRPPR